MASPTLSIVAFHVRLMIRDSVEQAIFHIYFLKQDNLIVNDLVHDILPQAFLQPPHHGR
jgi:hypothetical protein